MLSPDIGCSVSVFREPLLDTSYPDLVLVEWNVDELFTWMQLGPHLPLDAIDLLAVLFARQRMTRNDAQVIVGGRFKSTAKLIVDRGVAEWDGEFLTWSHKIDFAAKRIVTLEAKMSDRQEVHYQACNHLSYASESIVLTPRRAAPGKVKSHPRLVYLSGEDEFELKGAGLRDLAEHPLAWRVLYWVYCLQAWKEPGTWMGLR